MNPQDAPHILVIDDDPAFNRVLTRALSQRGFTVFGAADPENGPVTPAGMGTMAACNRLGVQPSSDSTPTARPCTTATACW